MSFNSFIEKISNDVENVRQNKKTYGPADELLMKYYEPVSFAANVGTPQYFLMLSTLYNLKKQGQDYKKYISEDKFDSIQRDLLFLMSNVVSNKLKLPSFDEINYICMLDQRYYYQYYDFYDKVSNITIDPENKLKIAKDYVDNLLLIKKIDSLSEDELLKLYDDLYLLTYSNKLSKVNSEIKGCIENSNEYNRLNEQKKYYEKLLNSYSKLDINVVKEDLKKILVEDYEMIKHDLFISELKKDLSNKLHTNDVDNYDRQKDDRERYSSTIRFSSLQKISDDIELAEYIGSAYSKIEKDALLKFDEATYREYESYYNDSCKSLASKKQELDNIESLKKEYDSLGFFKRISKNGRKLKKETLKHSKTKKEYEFLSEQNEHYKFKKDESKKEYERMVRSTLDSFFNSINKIMDYDYDNIVDKYFLNLNNINFTMDLGDLINMIKKDCTSLLYDIREDINHNKIISGVKDIDNVTIQNSKQEELELLNKLDEVLGGLDTLKTEAPIYNEYVDYDSINTLVGDKKLSDEDFNNIIEEHKQKI